MRVREGRRDERRESGCRIGIVMDGGMKAMGKGWMEGDGEGRREEEMMDRGPGGLGRDGWSERDREGRAERRDFTQNKSYLVRRKHRHNHSSHR